MPAAMPWQHWGAARAAAEESTFRRAFTAVDADKLDSILGAWLCRIKAGAAKIARGLRLAMPLTSRERRRRTVVMSVCDGGKERAMATQDNEPSKVVPLVNGRGADDLCDRCGANAHVFAVFESGLLGFCAHHDSRYRTGLLAAGARIVDRSDQLNRQAA
jgi:hypothetical protein